jgi:hypothetical protein
MEESFKTIDYHVIIINLLNGLVIWNVNLDILRWLKNIIKF